MFFHELRGMGGWTLGMDSTLPVSAVVGPGSGVRPSSASGDWRNKATAAVIAALLRAD